MTLVSMQEMRAAADRLRDVAFHTPLVPYSHSNPGRPLRIKAESLQPVGAFKLRGAYNALAKLSAAEAKAGVVTHSSGNHGQAVAYAAHLLGMSATIIMPDVSTKMKIAATRGWGAQVLLVPVEERERAAAAILAERGGVFVSPYDHRDVIAGQATIGLEIAQDWPEVEVVLVPVSGGGLIAGVAAGIKAVRPDAKVIGVEPELAADAAESLRTGRLVTWPEAKVARTSADGLRSWSLGSLPWEHVQAYVDDIITVSEDELRRAVRALALRARLVAEPSGAAATAAYLYHSDELPTGRTVAVLSGGNVDETWFSQVIAEAADTAGDGAPIEPAPLGEPA